MWHPHKNSSLIGSVIAEVERQASIASSMAQLQLNVEMERGSPGIDSLTYSEYPLGDHYELRIKEMLTGISTQGLPLRLFQGEAKIRGQSSKQEAVKVWKLSSDEGCSFEFSLEGIPEGRSRSPDEYIHVLWLKVEVQDQGSFWRLTRFFSHVQELLLEWCGFRLMRGRAMWSSNSKIKGLTNPDMFEDWRWKPEFIGWDKNLEPIVVSGLIKMYLRMGFLLDPSSRQSDEAEMLFLSNRAIQEFVEAKGSEAWCELSQFSFQKRKANRNRQNERAARIQNPEIAIENAKSKYMEREKARQRDFENLCKKVSKLGTRENWPFPF